MRPLAAERLAHQYHNQDLEARSDIRQRHDGVSRRPSSDGLEESTDNTLCTLQVSAPGRVVTDCTYSTPTQVLESSQPCIEDWEEDPFRPAGSPLA